MSTDGLERCVLLWCYYQLFGLSFWRHPFTAEDLWVSKWCNATFLNDLWVTTFLENVYIFGMNYFFKVHPKMKNLTINGDKRFNESQW